MYTRQEVLTYIYLYGRVRNMKKIIAIAGFVSIFISSALDVSAGYFNNDPIIRCESQIYSTLQIGSENSQVFTLQNILASTGYLGATPNGYFGRQTKNAVQSFQISNGISPTGIVGPMTREVLNNTACGSLSNNYSTASNYTFNPYNYTSGVTYVGANDPFVTVITPPVANPVVYTSPNSAIYGTQVVTANTNYTAGQVSATPIQMGTSYTQNQIASTQIVYNPASGYSYGITPASGSVTVSSPKANTYYNEGDTVFVNWTTNNLQTYNFNIVLESTISGQSRIVGTTSGNSHSFVLSRDILEAICSGTCNNNQQGSFKIVVTTPTTDIAGITSTLRAAVAPITIRRPLANAQVTITTSKTPVNTGEIFKLYVNVPTNTYGYNTSDTFGNYSVRLRAVCPPSVTASIAGVACGQEFVIPTSAINAQQEIPAIITNPTWYKQEVTFQVTVVNLANQIIGTAETKVLVNGSPFSF